MMPYNRLANDFGEDTNNEKFIKKSHRKIRHSGVLKLLHMGLNKITVKNLFRESFKKDSTNDSSMTHVNSKCTF